MKARGHRQPEKKEAQYYATDMETGPAKVSQQYSTGWILRGMP